MNKDVRPVYMGTFEKYKKTTDTEIEKLWAETKKTNQNFVFLFILIAASFLGSVVYVMI